MRIMVIGAPGVGKSTFTKKLSKLINIPVLHLDDFYWLRSWQRPSEEEWLSTLQKLVAPEKWIIDGNYQRYIQLRLERADYVLYLDYSIIRCFFQILKRTFIRYFVASDSLPAAIRDDPLHKKNINFDWRFIKLIVLFKLKNKPTILQSLANSKVKFFIFKSPSESQKFLLNATCLLKDLSSE